MPEALELFRAVVDNTNPIAYGMPAEADLYFVSGTRRGRGDADLTPAPEADRRTLARRGRV